MLGSKRWGNMRSMAACGGGPGRCPRARLNAASRLAHLAPLRHRRPSVFAKPPREGAVADLGQKSGLSAVGTSESLLL
jgi:hypothetical protein